jgi:surface protein
MHVYVSIDISTYICRWVGVDRVRLILQAFGGASAFNANIGAWNTASVKNLSQVRRFCRQRATRQMRHKRAHNCDRVRSRACARAFPLARIHAETMRALPVGVDRVRLDPQAFNVASAFNANIGAWNTASVTNMYQVRAAFSAGGGTMRPTRSIGIRCGVAVVRGGTADVRRGRCAHKS